MSLEDLLAQTIEDEDKRKQVLDALKEDRAGLERNKQQILDEKKQSDQKLKELEGSLTSLQAAFGDRTPEDVKAMMDRLEGDEMARLAAEGKTEELVKKHKEKWEADQKSKLQALQSQLDEMNETNQKLSEQLTSELVDNRALQAASKVGAIPESMDVVKMLAKSAWKLEDGEPVLRDKNGEIVTGKSGAMSFEEWADGPLREAHPYLFPQPKGGGAQGNNGSGSSGKNPWAKDSFNLTEQGRITREDPAKAERLQKEAQQ